MKLINLPLLLLITLGSNFYVMAEEKVDHSHHHDASQQQIVLNHGEKWAIDESLHIGMTSIKQEITKHIDEIHYDRFTEPQYAQLAGALNNQLNYLFENCKLPPEADAQLHILLAQIAEGAGKMKQGNKKKQGAILVIKALKDYPDYFNDPQWQALLH
ncbi:hypothetical protein [Thalassotalea piscium]|uniref:DnrO protein n=1 Tax=Thalassotalea piscium TaxID=1230533 RepID=A0A7X0NJ42_9GAMM|nr:hypothetical protein [Thalassotalea piscium]MBB6544236.1 hypothetical protein [Thalassotalea piscium]